MIEDWERPRHQCLTFMMETGGIDCTPDCLSKEDFDDLVTSGEFEIGPHKESFGDGYGDPYNPWRQAFGKLKDGRLVFTELYGGWKDD